MTFVKGQSGNPLGRPRGISDIRNTFKNVVKEEDRRAIVKNAVKKAIDGDSDMMKYLMDRWIPAKYMHEIEARERELEIFKKELEIKLLEEAPEILEKLKVSLLTS